MKTNVVGDEISYIYSRWPPASKVCREVLERILKDILTGGLRIG